MEATHDQQRMWDELQMVIDDGVFEHNERVGYMQEGLMEGVRHLCICGVAGKDTVGERERKLKCMPKGSALMVGQRLVKRQECGMNVFPVASETKTGYVTGYVRGIHWRTISEGGNG